jgi:hypothetical protein
MKWILAVYILFPGEGIGEQDAWKETHVASHKECRQALRLVSKEMRHEKLDFQWYGVCYDAEAPDFAYTYTWLGTDQDFTVKKYVSPTDGDKD